MTIEEYLGTTAGTSSTYAGGWTTHTNSTTTGDWDWAYRNYRDQYDFGWLKDVWSVHPITKIQSEDECCVSEEIIKYLSEFNITEET